MPFAAHTGYGIALLIEMLSGVLAAATVAPHVGNLYDNPTGVQNLGHGFGAIRVEALAAYKEFAGRMDALIREVRESPRGVGVDRIYLPGEIEFELADRNRREGVPLALPTVNDLRELGARLGVALRPVRARVRCGGRGRIGTARKEERVNIIVRDFVRPDPQVVRGFEGIPTSVVSDAMGRTGSMGAEIKPVWPRARIVGPALTVRTYPADNLMIHKAVTLAKRGDVLVVNAGGYQDTAVFGDLLGYSCKVHHLAGVVIDGASRDAEGLAAIGFPVFACAVLPMGPFKDSPGSINVPVSCGGVAVRPGDIIVADGDGVVVVPMEEAADVLAKAQAAAAKEQQMRERLTQGEYLYDILQLGEALKGLGVAEQ